MSVSDEQSDDFDEYESALPLGEGIQLAIADEQSHVSLDPALLNQVVESLLTAEGITDADISVAVVDDAAIHVVNREYLKHDYPTDVISFLLSENHRSVPKEGSVSIEGEIVISGETAARTAIEFDCPPHHELTLYLVHGLLHLCGYDDQTESDRETMRAQERLHLQKFGMEPHY